MTSFTPSDWKRWAMMATSWLDAASSPVGTSSMALWVADVEDIIRSKETAGLPKDLQVLPTLYRFVRDKKMRDHGDNRDAGLDIGF
jgi:hypothetical protein